MLRLNLVQSQKEIEDGKINFVLLHMRENPEANIEDSIAYTREILEEKKKEFLQHVLMDGFSDLPKQCRLLHLSCLKVFNMFFNSTNLFDSNTELIQDIKKAIYVPLEDQNMTSVKLPLSVHSSPKKYSSITTAHFTYDLKYHNSRRIIRHPIPKIDSVDGCGKGFISTMFKFCFA